MPEAVGKERCICQICTCGRHRCPHNPNGVLEDVTTNKHDFVSKNVERVQPIKREDELKLNHGTFEASPAYADEYKNWSIGKPERVRPSNDYHPPDVPFEGETTSKATYLPTEFERRRGRRPNSEIKLSEGEFEGVSSQKADFVQHQVTPRRRRQTESYKPSSATFDGVTTNTREYVVRDTLERTQPIRPRENQKLFEGEFEGKTTSKNDYQVHSTERTQPFKPTVAPLMSTEPLDGVTTIKEDYPPWDVQPREKRKQQEYVKPEGEFNGTTTNKSEFKIMDVGERAQLIRRHTNQKLFEGQFEGQTTNQENFKTFSLERAQLIKPKESTIKSTDPFVDTTTAKSDFPQWEVQERQKRAPQEYIRPEGKFDGTTTNKSDFVNKNAEERVQPVRPHTSQKIFEGQFEGQTTSQNEFINYTSERTQPIRPKDSTVISTDQFVDTTTAKSDYPQWEVQQRQMRAPQEYIKPEGQFEGMTTNRSEFKGADGKERAQLIRRRTNQKLFEGEFEGSTTNQNDFKTFSSERTQAIRPKESTIKSTDPFVDSTTAKSDFPQWEVQERQRRAPQEYIRPEGEFDGTTTNRSEFKNMDGGERAQPIRPRTSQKVFEGDFEGKTTNQENFQNYSSERTQPIKPKDSTVMSSDPFVDATTAKSDYPAWEVQQRQKRTQEEYIKPEGKFEGITTNKSEFAGRDALERTQAIRPKQNQKLFEGEFEGKTTSQNDYQVHSTERTQPFKPTVAPLMSTEPLDGVTTIKEDYPAWDIQPREKRKQQEYIRPEGEFDGTTTNKSEFISRDIAEKAQLIRPHTSQKIFEGQFEGQTTSQNEFKNYTSERTQPIRPKDSTVMSTDPFVDTTTAKSDYPQWEVQQRQMRAPQEYIKPEGQFEGMTTNRSEFKGSDGKERAQLIRRRTNQKLFEGEFEGSTTNQNDFKTFSSERTQAIRPKESTIKSTDPFVDSTTAKSDFPQWEVQERQRRAPQEYIRPEGEFDGTTTNRSEFKNMDGGERAQPIRPRTSQKVFEGDFEGKTTNQENFQNYSSERTQPIKPKDSTVISSDPFVDATTAKSDYPAWEVQQRQKRTQEEYIKPEGKFEGITTNKSEFAGRDALERTQPIRPKQNQKLFEGEFEGKTTSQNDYQVHSTERTQPFKPTVAPLMSTEPLDGVTTIKEDYPPWDVQPREKRKQQEYVRPEGEFDGTTTNKSEFISRDIAEKTQPIRPHTSQKIFDGQFEGQTTSQNEFKNYTSERTQPIRPKDSTVMSTDPFVDTTTAKSDYPQWEVQQRQMRAPQEYIKPEGQFEGMTTNRSEFKGSDGKERAQLIRRRTNQKLFEGEFEGSTTNQNDFKTFSSERTQAIRPKESTIKSTDPFVDSTTAKSDFPQWEVQERQRRAPQEYIRPEGEFDGTTTNRSEFKNMDGGERAQPIRPRTSQKVFEGDFEGKTTNQENFQNYSSERTQPIKPKDSTVISSDPFVDATTAKSDYPAWEVQQRQKRTQEEYIKPEGKFEGITTNKSEFAGRDALERTQPIRPKQNQKLFEGEFEGKTTSQNDYQVHSTERTQPFKPTVAPLMSTEPLDGVTTIKEDYPPWDVQPREKRKQQEYVRPEGEFDGTTTNKSEFISRDIAEKTQPIRPHTSQKIFDGQFEGQTTSQNEFKNYTSERTQPIRPKDSTVMSTDPFVDTTTAKSDYPQWEVQQRQMRAPQEYIKPEGQFEGMTTNRSEFKGADGKERAQLIRRRTNQKLFEGEFEGSTTNQNDFKTFSSERTQAIRPKESTIKSTDPFVDSTTAKSDFPQWEVQERQRRAPQEYIRPEGEFDGTTTNRSEFKNMDGGERAQPIRPRTSQKVFEGDFEGKTTNQENFQNYSLERTQPIKPKDSTVMSSDPFVDATTAKSDYPAWEVQQRQKRTKEEYIKPEGKFEGITTNKSEFAGRDALERTQAIRPKQNQKLFEGEFEGKTTSQNDYQVHSTERTQPFKPTVAPLMSTEPLDGVTTIKEDYPAWDIQPREKRKQQEYIRPEGEFDGTTTNKSEFISRDIAEKAQPIRPHTSQKIFEGQFEGQTTSQNEFKNYTLERTQPIRPKDSTVMSTDPFVDTTTAKSDYPQWEVQQRQMRAPQEYIKPEGQFEGMTTNRSEFKGADGKERAQLIRRRTNQKLFEGEFEGSTTNQNDFKTFSSERTQAIRPKESTIKSTDPFVDSTTAKSDFPQWEVQERQRRAPQEYIRSEGEFDGTTTNRSEFKNMDGGERAQLICRRTNQKLFEGQFESQTTNQENFKTMSSERAQLIKPKESTIKSTDPFVDTTTAKSDYPAWKVQERQKRAQKEYVKPEGAFDGTTTSKSAFVDRQLGDRVQLIRPHTNQKLFEGQFEGRTTNKSEFARREIGERAQPIRPKTSQRVNGGKFDGYTTNKQDFQNYSTERTKPSKHKDTTVMSTDAFQDSTTAKSDYPAWNVQARQKRVQQEYIKPEGKFDGTTTNRSEFLNLPMERTQPIRPEIVTIGGGQFEGTTTNQSTFTNKQIEVRQPFKPKLNSHIGGGIFEGETTNKSVYRQWEAAPSQKVTIVQEYKPPTDKFAATSTTKSDFLQYASGEHRARAIKNAGSTLTLGHDSTFDGKTSYSSQYQPTVTAPRTCPAGLLDTPRAGFEYKRDLEGHKFYNPKKTVH